MHKKQISFLSRPCLSLCHTENTIIDAFRLRFCLTMCLYGVTELASQASSGWSSCPLRWRESARSASWQTTSSTVSLYAGRQSGELSVEVWDSHKDSVIVGRNSAWNSSFPALSQPTRVQCHLSRSVEILHRDYVATPAPLCCNDTAQDNCRVIT